MKPKVPIGCVKPPLLLEVRALKVGRTWVCRLALWRPLLQHRECSFYNEPLLTHRLEPGLEKALDLVVAVASCKTGEKADSIADVEGQLRRRAVIPSLAGAGATIEQELRDAGVAVLARHKQRRHAISIHLIFVGATVEQKTRYLGVAKTASAKQGRRAALARLIDASAAVEQKARDVDEGELARIQQLNLQFESNPQFLSRGHSEKRKAQLT